MTMASNDLRRNFESRTICYHLLGVGYQVGGEEVGHSPEFYAHNLRRTISNLLPMGLL